MPPRIWDSGGKIENKTYSQQSSGSRRGDPLEDTVVRSPWVNEGRRGLLAYTEWNQSAGHGSIAKAIVVPFCDSTSACGENLGRARRVTTAWGRLASVARADRILSSVRSRLSGWTGFANWQDVNRSTNRSARSEWKSLVGWRVGKLTGSMCLLLSQPVDRIAILLCRKRGNGNKHIVFPQMARERERTQKAVACLLLFPSLVGSAARLLYQRERAP